MDRREFLKAASIAGAAGITLPFGAQAIGAGGKKMVIGIAGGGIVGASIAMHLAKMGADVIVFEKNAPGMGTTAKSLAWINPFVLNPHYQKLRMQSMERWKKYDAPLGLGVTWGGYINWTDVASEKEWVESYARPLDGTPWQVKRLQAEDFKTLSPSINPGDFVWGYHSTVDGHVDPVFVTGRFLAEAKKAGAKVMYPCEVQEMEFANGKLTGVKTTKGSFKLDKLVLATSNDSPAMLAKLGYELEMQHKPGVLVHSKPLPILSKMVYDGPGELEWKQMANGSIVGMEATAPPRNIPAHGDIISRKIDFPPGMAEAHGARILQKLSKYQPALKDAQVDYVTLGFRPLPKDGFPVCGTVPGARDVYTCVSHSGVTLSMVFGDYVSQEIMTGVPNVMFEPYRPERFLVKAAVPA